MRPQAPARGRFRFRAFPCRADRPTLQPRAQAPELTGAELRIGAATKPPPGSCTGILTGRSRARRFCSCIGAAPAARHASARPTLSTMSPGTAATPSGSGTAAPGARGTSVATTPKPPPVTADSAIQSSPCDHSARPRPRPWARKVRGSGGACRAGVKFSRGRIKILGNGQKQRDRRVVTHCDC